MTSVRVSNNTVRYKKYEHAFVRDTCIRYRYIFIDNILSRILIILKTIRSISILESTYEKTCPLFLCYIL